MPHPGTQHLPGLAPPHAPGRPRRGQHPPARPGWQIPKWAARRIKRGGDRPRRYLPLYAPDETAIPDPVDELTFIALWQRQRATAGMKRGPRIDLYKNLRCELEALRRLAHKSPYGGTIATSSFQLTVSLSKHHGERDMSGSVEENRDAYWPDLRRHLLLLQSIGLLRYRIDQDDDLNDRRLLLTLLPAPAVDVNEITEAGGVLEAWRKKYGESLDTASQWNITDLRHHAEPLRAGARKSKAIAQNKARYRKRRAGTRGSVTKLPHPSGAFPPSEDGKTPLTATNGRTRTNDTDTSQPPTTQEPTQPNKNSSIEKESAKNESAERELIRQRIRESLEQAERKAGLRKVTNGYRYWQADLTYDVDAYRRELYGWILGAQMGGARAPAPTPGQLMVGERVDTIGYEQAQRAYAAAVAAAEALQNGPDPERGPYDLSTGVLDYEAYHGALAMWNARGRRGPAPHPGHRPQSRRYDRQWHQAIELYNETDEAITRDQLEPAVEIEAALLTEIPERQLRTLWVIARWGHGDLQARGLYGAGPTLTPDDLDAIRYAERLWLAHGHLADPQWPREPLSAILHIAQQRRANALEPIDPVSAVGGLRLLMDGVRRLTQQGKRLRSQTRAGDPRRLQRRTRRQITQDQRRARSPIGDWRRGNGHNRYTRVENEHPADDSLRWQLAHMPLSILTDQNGVPYFDEYGRFVMHPDYLPEDSSRQEERYAANERALWKAVYLRLGVPLPAEHDGALYQTLKAQRRLPPAPDRPLYARKATRIDAARPKVYRQMIIDRLAGLDA